MKEPVSSENHEEEFIKSFVKKDKQERFLLFTKNPKHRKKFISGLSHSKDIEPKYIHTISADCHTAEKIENLLKKNGASNECYVISEYIRLDQKQCNLLWALTEVLGSGVCTIISCIPGKLAYYEGEERGARYLLVNRTTA